VPSTIDTLNFDCADPRRLAGFWCGVLGYQLQEIDDTGSWIKDPARKGVDILFAVVPEGKAVKNRLHLDLIPPESMEAEVERVKALGATVFRFVEESDSFWTVMQDPEGNEFCILRGPVDRARQETATKGESKL
jgi:predicted enzyme related to lactoylglutathione lyase